MKEVWRDCKHYEDCYEISNYGRVRNKNTGHYKKLCTKENGYLIVHLYVNGTHHNEYVHRLVALTFIPNPDKLPQVNHKDENKTNNYVDNLEWCDAAYNNNYGTARERMLSEENPSKKNPKSGSDNSHSKAVVCNGKLFHTIKDCANYYGVNYKTMRVWLCTNKIPKYFEKYNLHYA